MNIIKYYLLGCLLGMFPLYFLDTHEGVKLRNEHDTDTMLADLTGKLNSLPVRYGYQILINMICKVNKEVLIINLFNSLVHRRPIYHL
jgi:hypothetical protein